MPERFEIRTTKRSVLPVLSDYYETAIYDRETRNMVICAGDTPAESLAQAEQYLALLNRSKAFRQEAKLLEM